jgi:GGDEF domain-containing protein
MAAAANHQNALNELGNAKLAPKAEEIQGEARREQDARKRAAQDFMAATGETAPEFIARITAEAGKRFPGDASAPFGENVKTPEQRQAYRKSIDAVQKRQDWVKQQASKLDAQYQSFWEKNRQQYMQADAPAKTEVHPNYEQIGIDADSGQPILKQKAERRLDTNERKRVSQMSPEEMQKELLTSESLNLPNKRAFLEEEARNPSPAISMSDADGLKAFNDKFGYEYGNKLLEAKAEALKEAGLDAYHEKGDEFLQRDGTTADLQNKLEHARELLRNKEIEVELNDGTIKRYKGVDFSYGVGKDLSEAEANLKQHKATREARGERARGELRGITEVGSQADQVPQGSQLEASPARAEASQPQGSVSRSAVEASPKFKKFFRDSKVVDESGNPKIVYHGTNNPDLSSFSLDAAGKKTGNPNAGLGFFFTDNPQEASRYAEGWGKPGGNVIPAYVSIKNPYEMPYKEFDDLAMASYRRMQADPSYDPNSTVKFGDVEGQRAAADRVAKYEAEARAATENRRKELIAQGYDGIVIKGSGMRPTEYVAFEPNQIKSAIGNSGKFDKTSASLTDHEKAQAAKKRLNEKLGRSHSGVPVDAIPDLLEYGYYTFKAGARTFAEWSAKMLKDFGEQVRPHLKKAWDDIQEKIANGEEIAKPKNLARGSAALAEKPKLLAFLKAPETKQASGNTPPKVPTFLKTESSPEGKDNFAGNINLDKLNTPEEIKAELKNVYRLNKDKIEKQRRGAVSDASVEKAAREMGLTADDISKWKKGGARNAETIFAARHVMVGTAEALNAAKDKFLKSHSPVDLANFQEAVAKHVAVQTSVAGATAEAGRALRQFR